MTPESPDFSRALSSSFRLLLHQKSFKLAKNEGHLLTLLPKTLSQRGVIGGWK